MVILTIILKNAIQMVLVQGIVWKSISGYNILFICRYYPKDAVSLQLPFLKMEIGL